MHPPDTLVFFGESGFVSPALGRFMPTVDLELEFAVNRFAASLTKSVVLSSLSLCLSSEIPTKLMSYKLGCLLFSSVTKSNDI